LIKYEKLTIAYFLKIRYILYRKYVDNRKITMRLTEEQVIQSLKSMGEQYAPLIINRLAKQVSLPQGCKVALPSRL